MPIKELFELIRKEKVCLFVGSGFSLYAGMPSAAEIKKLLYESLNDLEKVQLNLNDNLRQFTRDFVVLKGRDYLIKLIQKRFSQEPVSTFYHDLLSRISYFKVIITTNYDRLIEDSYKRKIGIIVNDQDVFIGSQAPTKLFKVHGDINDAKSIIVTEKDYSDLYNRDFKTPFLASFLSEISSHHILFLGYGYEDGNILADFDKVESELLASKKRKFLIAPHLTSLQQKRLEELDIFCITMTGQDFLEELVKELKSNLVIDYSKGFVDSQTAQDFAKSFGMDVEITASESRGQSMFLSKSTGDVKYNVTMSTNNPAFQEEFEKFTFGYRTIEITKEMVQDFRLELNGFTLLNLETLHSFKIQPKPITEGKCGLEFSKEDFDLENIKFEIYKRGHMKILVKASIYGFEIEIELDLGDQVSLSNIHIQEPRDGTSARRSFKVYKIITLLFSGELFDIRVKHKKVFHSIAINNPSAVDQFEPYRDFFSKLVDIEKYFKIEFGQIKINDISVKTKENVEKMTALIKHNYYAFEDREGVTFLNLPKSRLLFKRLNTPIPVGNYVYILSAKDTNMKIFDIEIDLGRQQTIMLQPTAVDANFGKNTITFLAKDDIVVYRFEKFGLIRTKTMKALW